MKIECYSGGASGSDYAWVKVCERFKIPSHVFTFLGHRGLVLPKNRQFCHTYTHNDNELKLGHQPLLKANETLRRNYPAESPWTNRLLRRNYLIVRHVGQVFGIGSLNNPKTIVSGGTGWGVQMGIDLGLDVYVFEQDLGVWCKWGGSQFVPMIDPPIIAGKFAGIGTRQINPAGVQAIVGILRESVVDEINNIFLQC